MFIGSDWAERSCDLVFNSTAGECPRRQRCQTETGAGYGGDRMTQHWRVRLSSACNLQVPTRAAKISRNQRDQRADWSCPILCSGRRPAPEEIKVRRAVNVMEIQWTQMKQRNGILIIEETWDNSSKVATLAKKT